MGTVRGFREVGTCVDHLRHCTGLTGRLRIASNGTGILNFPACRLRGRLWKYQNPTPHSEPFTSAQRREKAMNILGSNYKMTII